MIPAHFTFMRIKWPNVDNPPLASYLIGTGANKWHRQYKWLGDGEAVWCVYSRKWAYREKTASCINADLSWHCINHLFALISWLPTMCQASYLVQGIQRYIYIYFFFHWKIIALKNFVVSQHDRDIFKNHLRTGETHSFMVVKTLQLRFVTPSGRYSAGGTERNLWVVRESHWAWVRWEEPEKISIHLSHSASYFSFYHLLGRPSLRTFSKLRSSLSQLVGTQGFCIQNYVLKYYSCPRFMVLYTYPSPLTESQPTENKSHFYLESRRHIFLVPWDVIQSRL